MILVDLFMTVEASMTIVSVDDLPGRLPQILNGLREGEVFLLNDNGQLMASIQPFAPSRPLLTAEERQQAFEAWMKNVEARAGRYPPGFTVDDSYEAIYGERENAPL
jgi:hypothetical protein